MLNLVRADLYKLRKSVFFKAAFLISCAAAAAFIFFSWMLSTGRMMTDTPASMLSDIQMMSLLGSAAAAVLVCGDFDNHSIHHSIASGAGRGTIVMSKYIVFFVVVVFLLLPYIVISIAWVGLESQLTNTVPSAFSKILLNWVFGTGGDWPPPTNPMTVSNFFKLLGLSFTIITIYIGQLSIVVLFAFLIRKAVFVILSGYAFLFAMGQLVMMENRLGRMLTYTPFGGDYTMLGLDSTGGEIAERIGVSLAFTAVMVIITWMAFRNSEVR